VAALAASPAVAENADAVRGNVVAGTYRIDCGHRRRPCVHVTPVASTPKDAFSNDVRARAARHEMQPMVMSGSEAPGFPPFEVTLLGPIEL
jgi:hypothetical protein